MGEAWWLSHSPGAHRLQPGHSIPLSHPRGQTGAPLSPSLCFTVLLSRSFSLLRVSALLQLSQSGSKRTTYHFPPKALRAFGKGDAVVPPLPRARGRLAPGQQQAAAEQSSARISHGPVPADTGSLTNHPTHYLCKLICTIQLNLLADGDQVPRPSCGLGM